MRAPLAGHAVALLPRVPATYVGEGPLLADLERFGSRAATRSPDVAIGAEAAVATGAATAIDIGGGARRLRAAGYAVERYRVRRVAHGSVALVRRGSARSLPRRRLRSLVADAIDGRLWGSVVVAGRLGATPAAVVAAGGQRCDLALLSDDPRRRTALFGGSVVAKVGRAPGEDVRGRNEQAVLRLLHEAGLGARVPTPLGCGDLDGLPWSAETVAPGSPLEQQLDAMGPGRAAGLLADVAAWLGDLAAATRSEGRWEHGVPDDVLPLRGPAADAARALAPCLEGVPAVVVHGDLASGANVLVAGSAFALIDWETARPAGLPLVDLLPLLCLATARAHGCRGAEAEAAFALDLCRGRLPESGWLFELVDAYAAAVVLPSSSVGALAWLAWGYQASMRSVHEELLLAAGGTPVAWTSAAEIVAAAWGVDASLGAAWRGRS